MDSVRFFVVFFFKQKTADEMGGRDWSSDVCSSDLVCDEWDRVVDGHSPCAVSLRHEGGDSAAATTPHRQVDHQLKLIGHQVVSDVPFLCRLLI